MNDWMEMVKRIEQELVSGLRENRTLRQVVSELSEKYSYGDIITVLERGAKIGVVFIYCRGGSAYRAYDVFRIGSFYYALRADVGDCGEGKYDPLTYDSPSLREVVASVLSGVIADDIYFISPSLAVYAPFPVPEDRMRGPRSR